MKQRERIYYSPEQKALIWDKYKRGDSQRRMRLNTIVTANTCVRR